MTPELEKEFDVLKENVIRFKELHSVSIADNNRLKQEIAKLTGEIETKEKENKVLENKYESLKLAKIIASSSTDTHDAKIKLNRIVREIDKCISLLNK